jgi:hypothetical protein
LKLHWTKPRDTGMVQGELAEAEQPGEALGVHCRYMVAEKEAARSPIAAAKLMPGLSLVLFVVPGGIGYG